MPEPLSQKVTITLPATLLAKLDKLAAYGYASRTDIIRQAVVQLIHEPQNELIVSPDTVVTGKMYDYIKTDHPYLDPDDTVLIRFLYKQKMSGD